MLKEKSIAVDEYIFQIVETDDAFYISVCSSSDYEDDTTAAFCLIDVCAKCDGYSADIVDTLVHTQDYLLFAVKAMLDDSQYRRKCNAPMGKEISKGKKEKGKPPAEPIKLCEKPFLTIEEMAKYSGIGEKKLAWIIENYASYENNFVIKNGTKNLFKRELFLEFLNKTDAI